jgi:hypothetical protein
MDVRIGVTQSTKELHLELADDADRDKLIAEIDAAVASDGQMLWLTDRKGRRVGVPAAKVAYVEVGSPEASRVGFGTH